MIKIKEAIAVVLMASVAFGGVALAAEAKTYKAVGKLRKLTTTEILVATSSQDLEITHDAKTKIIGGELKSGGVATVIYTKVGGQPYATQITMSPAKQ